MAFSSHPLPLANHPFSLKIDTVATDIKKKKKASLAMFHGEHRELSLRPSTLQSAMGEDDEAASGARNLGMVVGSPHSSALQL